MNHVPDLRLSLRSAAPVNPGGAFVLYWMTAARRVTWNFALQRAVAWARDLRKPLLLLESLPSGLPWDSDRLHKFILDGMADTARRLKGKPVRYWPHVGGAPGEVEDLASALAGRAAVVVTDGFPCFVWPRLVVGVAARSAVRLEEVDSGGLLPILAADRVFPTAFGFRAFLQRHLPAYLGDVPAADPLERVRLPALRSLPRDLARRWPRASVALLRGEARALASLPIDHGVGPAPVRGGTAAAEAALTRFVDERLADYAARRSHPDDDATSGLSPYLHFGHISVHQVFAAVMTQCGWTADRFAPSGRGKREGWWGTDASTEALLDELVTWRELGYIFCARREDYDRYDSLPAWARRTLDAHRRDKRPYLYSRGDLEAARTHDRLWNAAQTQLVREGRLHNTLRMLWGKKVLEWSASPEEALDTLIDLNNKYALDGRNPNSYTGVCWVLGRHDRAWGPERPVFGTVRYMSSASTARKVRVKRYLATYAPDA